MGCSIKVVKALNGKDSILYKSLLKSTSAERALATYVLAQSTDFNEWLNAQEKLRGHKMRDKNGEVLAEYVGAYKNEVSKNTVFKLLPAFETHRDQIDGIDHITSLVLSELKGMGLESKFGTLSKENVKPKHIITAIDNMYSKLEDQAAAFEQKLLEAENSGNEEAIEANAYGLNNIEALLSSWRDLVLQDENGQRGAVSLALAQLGVNTMSEEVLDNYSETQKSNDENSVSEGDVISEDISPTKIYDKDSIEDNPKDSISVIVKTALYDVKEVPVGTTVDSYTVDSIVPTNYGTARRANTHELIQYLLLNVQGVETVDEMMGRLEELQIANPQIIPIVRRLQNEDPTMTDQGEINLLKNAFFTTFANAHYDMVTVVEKGDGTISIMPTNRNKQQNMIVSDWASKSQAVINGYKQNLTGLQVTDLLNKNRAEVIKRLNDFFLSNRGDTKDSLGVSSDSNINNSGNKVVLTELSKFLAEIGIHVSPEALGTWRNDTGPLFAAEARGVLTHLLKGFWTDSDMFNYGVGRTSERKSILKLAQYEAKTKSDVAIGSFLSGTGSQVYAVNKPTEAIDIINRLTVNKDGVLDTYSDEVMSSLSIIQDLKSGVYGENNSNFRVATFDTLYNNNGSFGNGVKYSQLSTTDAVATVFNMFFSNASAKEFGYFFGPNPADRGRNSVLQIKKLNVDKDGTTTSALFEADSSGKYIAINKDNEVFSWLKKQVKAEIMRSLRIRQEYNEFKGTDREGELRENYHVGKNGELGNGGYLNLFPSLNKTLMTEEFINKNYKSLDISSEFSDSYEGIAENIVNSTEFHTEISKTMIEEFGRDMEYMEGLGIVSTDAIGNYSISPNMISRIHQGQNITSWDLQNMFANQLKNNYEQTLLYAGDIAFFANTDFTAENIDQTKQIADINKRLALPYTPGARIAAEKPTAIIKVMEDHKQDSDIMDQVNTLFKNVVAWKGVYIADGQGWMSLARYKNDILKGQGKLTPQMSEAIDRLIDGGKDVNDISIITDIVKGFYYSQEDSEMLSDSSKTTKTPMNIKYSSMPAIPALMEEMMPDGVTPKYKDLFNISQELNGVGKGKNRVKASNSADEVVMKSAVKVGNYNIAKTSEDLKTTNGIVIKNSSYRIPLEVQTKEKVKDNLGSQMRKLIEGNFKPHINIMGTSATEASQLYNDILSSFTDVEADILMNKFLDSDGNVNYSKMASFIVDFAEKNNTSSLDFIAQAMTKHADGRTKMTLNHPSMRKSVESAIASAFRNRVTRQNLPGYSAVQFTSYGMSIGKTNIQGDSSLRMIRLSKNGKELSKANNNMAEMERYKKLLEEIDEANIKGEDTTELVKELETYKVEPAEVKVTAQYFITSLTKKAEQDGVPVQEYLDLITKIDNKGNVTYDLEAIKKHGLDELVLYRIPTQAKNSMLSAKIVEFLPPNVGAAIAVPPGIVSQSGSDFDVDKVFIEMSNFYVKDGELKKVQYYKPGDSVPTEHVTHTKAGKVDGDFMFGLKEVNPNSKELRDVDLYTDRQGNTYSISKPSLEKGLFEDVVESVLRLNVLNPHSDGIHLVGKYTEDGIENPIFRQSTVKGEPSTVEEIDQHFKDLGYTKTKGGYKNNEYVVTNVSSETAITSEDGVVTIVDAIIEKVDTDEKANKAYNTKTMSKSAKQNFVVDYHKAVLNHPANFAENVAPNNMDTLVALAEKTEAINTNFATLRTQETLRTNNKAGKELIGFSSLSSVGYSIAPKLGLHFVKPVYVLGKPVEFTQEAQIYKGDEGIRLVSKDIEEIQNAAVDNVKNPVLGKLNITNYTASSVLLMVQGRSGLKAATDLVSSDIIRHLNNGVESFSRLLPFNKSIQRAVIAAEIKYNITNSKVEDRIEAGRKIAIETTSTEKLSDVLKDHNSTLNLFLYYNSQGKELYDAYVALNDSTGARSTAILNKNKYDNIAKIKGTRIYNRESNVAKNSTPPVEVSKVMYSRESVAVDKEVLYLFTDNAERTSDNNAKKTNISEDSWYFKKYYDKTDKVISFGTRKNPTSAVIRGLNNAAPISVMSKKGVNWTDSQFSEFKEIIDDEIEQIKELALNYKSIRISNSRIGQGGKFAKLTPMLQSYLDNALLEIGIDNSGTEPVYKPVEIKLENNKQAQLSKELGTSNIAVQSEVYNQHHSSSYEENGLIKPMNVLRKVSSSVSDTHQKAINTIEDMVYLTNSDKTAVLYAFDTYLASNSTATTIAKTEFAAMVEDSAGVREMFLPQVNNDRTLAAKLQLYRDYVMQLQKFNPDIKISKLVEHLKSKDSILPDGTKIRTVSFNSAVTKSASREEIMELADSLEELMQMSDVTDSKGNILEVTLPTGETMTFAEFANDLGVSIAAYNYLTSGFGKTIGSFSEVMSYGAHEGFGEFYENQGINTIDFFRELEGHPEKINEGAYLDFARKFLQHNPDKATWMGSKTIAEITAEIDPTSTDTSFYRDDTRRVLYELEGNTLVGELPYLGEGGLFMEYGYSVPAFKRTNVSGVTGPAKAFLSDVLNHNRVQEIKRQKITIFNEQLENLSKAELLVKILSETEKGKVLAEEVKREYPTLELSEAEMILYPGVTDRIEAVAKTEGKTLIELFKGLTKINNC